MNVKDLIDKLQEVVKQQPSMETAELKFKGMFSGEEYNINKIHKTTEGRYRIILSDKRG